MKTPNQTDGPNVPRVINQPWICWLALAVVFGLLTAWSWRKWPDVLVDYGQQLYIPWQLSEGKVLYHDLMYLGGGPLSQYFHALLFKLFGVSFMTLVVVNLLLLAGFIALLFRLFTRMADEVTGLVVCLTTLCAFAFVQLTHIGNYNYVCPYTYETVHGLMLAVSAVACLSRWISTRARWPAFASGLCAGGVFLTKPDVFLALVFVLGAAIVLSWLTTTDQDRRRLPHVWLLVIGAVLPCLLFVAYYATVLNIAAGIKAVCAAWIPVLTTSAAENKFHRVGMGLDQPWYRLMQIARESAWLLLSLGIIVSWVWLAPRRRWMAVTLGLGILALLAAATLHVNWATSGKSLGPVTVVGGAWLAWRWWGVRRSPDGRQWILPLLWSVLSLFMLVKTGLNTRIFHYGFYLAMPAAAFLVYLLIWLLPRELSRFGLQTGRLRTIICVFLAVCLARIVTTTQMHYAWKLISVGTGPDRIMTSLPAVFPHGAGIKLTTEWVQTNTPPDSTLAVMPEGVMINFQTRRPNPTPYVVFSPPEVLAFGETNMLSAYEQHAPDYVVLFHRDSSEFGYGYFGTDPNYGENLVGWVREHYTVVWQLKDEPLKNDLFGVQVLRRNDIQTGVP